MSSKTIEIHLPCESNGFYGIVVRGPSKSGNKLKLFNGHVYGTMHQIIDILPSSQALKTNQLAINDFILSINDINAQGISHLCFLSIIKKFPNGLNLKILRINNGKYEKVVNSTSSDSNQDLFTDLSKENPSVNNFLQNQDSIEQTFCIPYVVETMHENKPLLVYPIYIDSKLVSYKRYNEFFDFFNSLKETYNFSTYCMSFPPKIMFHNNSKIDQRRQKLEAFFLRLISIQHEVQMKDEINVFINTNNYEISDINQNKVIYPIKIHSGFNYIAKFPPNTTCSLIFESLLKELNLNLYKEYFALFETYNDSYIRKIDANENLFEIYLESAISNNENTIFLRKWYFFKEKENYLFNEKNGLLKSILSHQQTDEFYYYQMINLNVLHKNVNIIEPNSIYIGPTNCNFHKKILCFIIINTFGMRFIPEDEPKKMIEIEWFNFRSYKLDKLNYSLLIEYSNNSSLESLVINTELVQFIKDCIEKNKQELKLNTIVNKV